MLLAGSYGTHLALAVARRHPGAVARMVLLGVEGPDDTVKLPNRVDETLNRIDAAHPGLVASIRTLLERLRREPWTKTLPNGQPVTVGPWDLQRRVAESLDTIPEINALGPALAGMQQGDYSDLDPVDDPVSHAGATQRDEPGDGLRVVRVGGTPRAGPRTGARRPSSATR